MPPLTLMGCRKLRRLPSGGAQRGVWISEVNAAKQHGGTGTAKLRQSVASGFEHRPSSDLSSSGITATFDLFWVLRTPSQKSSHAAEAKDEFI